MCSPCSFSRPSWVWSSPSSISLPSLDCSRPSLSIGCVGLSYALVLRSLDLALSCSFRLSPARFACLRVCFCARRVRGCLLDCVCMCSLMQMCDRSRHLFFLVVYVVDWSRSLFGRVFHCFGHLARPVTKFVLCYFLRRGPAFHFHI